MNHIVTELVYFALGRDNIRTAWSVTVIPTKGVGDLYDIIIDAQTGELLRRQDRLVWDLTPMTFRVFPSDGVAPGSPGQAVPNGFQAPEVPRSLLVVNPADISAFSPDGWITAGHNDTFGNNVDAHLDLNADNNPDLPRPDGGTTRTFDFPFSSAQDPTSWENFAVTELFWRANWYTTTSSTPWASTRRPTTSRPPTSTARASAATRCRLMPRTARAPTTPTSPAPAPTARVDAARCMSSPAPRPTATATWTVTSSITK